MRFHCGSPLQHHRNQTKPYKSILSTLLQPNCTCLPLSTHPHAYIATAIGSALWVLTAVDCNSSSSSSAVAAAAKAGEGCGACGAAARLDGPAHSYPCKQPQLLLMHMHSRLEQPACCPSHCLEATSCNCDKTCGLRQAAAPPFCHLHRQREQAASCPCP